jgi:hypothetical protein
VNKCNQHTILRLPTGTQDRFQQYEGSLVL